VRAVTPAARRRPEIPRNGYEVVAGVLDPSDIELLASRLAHYERHPKRYGQALEFQYESGTSGRVRRMRRLAHEEPQIWSRIWRSSRVQDVLARLCDGEVHVAEQAAFMKPPHVGSRTPRHQDQAFWLRQARGALVCWVALDASTESNGCLVVYPGSHRLGLLRHEATSPLDHPEIPADLLRAFAPEPVPLQPGDALVWDRYLVHESASNTSHEARRGVANVFAADPVFTEAGPVAWPLPEDA
jgi:phytanoyl-CoA hydroxylase